LSVDAGEYEVVYSYFKNYTTDSSIAKSYSETLFRISNQTGQSIMDLLQTFQSDDNDSMKIALLMAYYLNTSSTTKTVLYGIDTELAPNETVQRNIIQ
jgi:hypothetical protein